MVMIMPCQSCFILIFRIYHFQGLSWHTIFRENGLIYFSDEENVIDRLLHTTLMLISRVSEAHGKIRVFLSQCLFAHTSVREIQKRAASECDLIFEGSLGNLKLG